MDQNVVDFLIIMAALVAAVVAALVTGWWNDRT